MNANAKKDDRHIDHAAAYQAQHDAWARPAERIASHPMYSPSDLKYLRAKGYSDEEILAFWDRDHGRGCEPVEHRFTYTGLPGEVVQRVMRDNLSPHAIATIATRLNGMALTASGAVNREVAWFIAQLTELVGGPEAAGRLSDEIES